MTAPGQAAVGRDLGGKLNSCVIQNRQTGVGEYVDVWFSDAQPDGQDVNIQFFFRIQPGTALIIDPSDTAYEETQRKISVQRVWFRGNAVSNPAYVDIFWTTKYAPQQGLYGTQHLVNV